MYFDTVVVVTLLVMLVESTATYSGDYTADAAHTIPADQPLYVKASLKAGVSDLFGGSNEVLWPLSDCFGHRNMTAKQTTHWPCHQRRPTMHACATHSPQHIISIHALTNSTHPLSKSTSVRICSTIANN
jgi:hypothetical protein